MWFRLSDLLQCLAQYSGSEPRLCPLWLLWWEEWLSHHIMEGHRPQPGQQRQDSAASVDSGWGWRGTIPWTYCTQWCPFVAHKQQVKALHVFPPSPPPLHGGLSVHEGAIEQMSGGRAGQAGLEQFHLSLKGIRHRRGDIGQNQLWSERWKVWGRACCLSRGLW